MKEEGLKHQRIQKVAFPEKMQISFIFAINTSAEGHCNGGAGSQITLLNVRELPQPSHFLFIVANSLLFKTRFRLKAKGVMRFRLRV